MNRDELQSVIDSRLASVQDHYMDDGAMLKLRHDLLHETHASRVEAEKGDDNVVRAKVKVGALELVGEVALSQVVPKMHRVSEPARVDYVFSGVDHEDDEDHAKAHRDDDHE